MVKIETDIQYIKSSIEELKEQHKQFIESADKKYASKLSEVIVYSLLGTIAFAVLYALLKGINLG